ncbi:MAG TPA: hypothetical protein VFI73_07655 [Candidatus Nitrosopolaris sp.]|nr:hypothetical protein [Candidatus Nitrosopolaris sp.]
MKFGAIISSVGAILLITLAAILLVYPIAKSCHERKCTFTSSAPTPLNSFVKPSFLATSLVIIAAGVALIRFGSWYQYKSKKAEKGMQ